MLFPIVKNRGILVSRVLPERMLLKGDGWKTKKQIETERSQNEKAILTLGRTGD
jgi:hypothetical protein